jgi:diamine N-acetyltransferase
MELRHATEADIAAIMEIERTPGFENYVGRSEAPDCRYIILEGEAGPAGFAILQGVGSPSGVVYLKRVAIRTPGKGLGKEFLTALISLSFLECGAHKFWLDAFETNARARHVYAACGLRLDGVLREHYPLADGSRANLVIMSILKREWQELDAGPELTDAAKADLLEPDIAEFLDAALNDITNDISGDDRKA